MVNTKELAETTEEYTEDSTIEINLRHSNFKYPNQLQNFQNAQNQVGTEYLENNGLESSLGLLDPAYYFTCLKKTFYENMITSGTMKYLLEFTRNDLLQMALEIKSILSKKEKNRTS